MSDEPGRGKFVDQAAEARPSVWRRTAGWIREEILHSLGRPARLEGAIASGQLIPCQIIAPVDTFWTRSVVYWQDWLSLSLSSFHSRPWTIDYRKMHDTEKAGVALRLAWLERAHPRASAVADVLSAAGFPDFGKQLQQLAKGSSGMISGDNVK
ncbi:hypothetical protein PF334_003590 [Salmonella enterica]|nr:hypothetical protein [Salmonella enterica]EGY9192738.1 hypothetical protein [Salmonella enterica]EIU1720557.1 hypothetical protein [Salmonella enterica]EKD9220288.1 hypothetical protein [Salmonella enterica]EKI6026577.1 hypothetical protein [Salmonella enterica]